MARLMIAIYPKQMDAELAKAALPPSHKNARISGPYDGVMVDDVTKKPIDGYEVIDHGLWILQSEV